MKLIFWIIFFSSWKIGCISQLSKVVLWHAFLQPNSPVQGHFALTLHNCMNFINDRNGEIQTVAIACNAGKMQGLLSCVTWHIARIYCHHFFPFIQLSFLVIAELIISELEPLSTAVLTWYTLKVDIWVIVKHTWEIDMLYLELLTRTLHAHRANRVILYHTQDINETDMSDKYSCKYIRCFFSVEYFTNIHVFMTLFS